jgi:hypothetical protein
VPLLIEIILSKLIPAIIDVTCIGIFAHIVLTAKPKVVLPWIGVWTLTNAWQIYHYETCKIQNKS